MAKLAELRNRVAPQVPNCPNPLIDRAIVDAARRLCQAVPIWRDTIALHTQVDGDDILLIPGEPGQFNASQGAVALSLADAYAMIQQDANPGVQPAAEMARVISPRVTIKNRAFADYRLTSRDVMTVSSAPAEIITVHVSLQPAQGSTTMPDEVIDYQDGVLSEALSELLSMSAQSWSNPNLAAYHHRRYRHVRVEAISDATRGFAQGSTRVAPRRFACFRR